MKRVKTKNRGEKNGRCKGSESVVLEIRAKHKRGYNNVYLAKLYSYSIKGIEAIVYRQTWKHL